MSQHRHLAIVGGAATVLASTALVSVYQSAPFPLFVLDQPNWFLYVAAAVATTVGAAIGARALRAPRWSQPLAGLAGLILFVTVVFGQGSELLGIIPTPGTLTEIARQLQVAFREIAELTAPVPVHRGLLLLAVLGVGVTAVVVDFLVATSHRTSLAGLPLLVLYAVPVSIDRDGLAWWTFGLGAIGYLWLLVTDQLVQVRRWGRPFRATAQADVFTSSSLGTTGRWVGAFGIIVAALLPLAVPGISTAGWFDWAAYGLGGRGGGSVSAIDPMTELKGRLSQRERIELLRLRTNDTQAFYLRLITLDKFGSKGWASRELTATPAAQLSRGVRDDDIPDGVPTVGQKTSIEIRAFDRSSYLPIYANPSKVAARGDWRWDSNADTAFSTKVKTRNLRYEFESRRVRYDNRALATAPDMSPGSAQVRNFTSVGRVEPGAKNIVDGLVRGKDTQFEKVVAINDYFAPQNGFTYSTQTKPGTTGSDLMDFLGNREGYCEQYASAMAYLVRVAGIPARVAIGFGYGRATDGYRSVTNQDAHAWVEVYFNGYGWVPFDPTPPGGTGSTGNLTWTRLPVDTGNGNGGPAPTAPSTGPSAPAPGTNPRDERPDADDGAAGVVGPQPLAPQRWLGLVFGAAIVSLDGRTLPAVPPWMWWLLAVAVGGAVFAMPALARVEVRRIRAANARSTDSHGRPQSVLVAAHSAWDELLDTLSDLHNPVDESDTPRVVSHRLARHLSADGARAAANLAAAEEQVRYAPAHRRQPTPDLAPALRLVLREVTANAPRAVRVRARLLPPSVLARMARRLQAWNEGVSMTVADARLVLARLSPARLLSGRLAARD